MQNDSSAKLWSWGLNEEEHKQIEQDLHVSVEAVKNFRSPGYPQAILILGSAQAKELLAQRGRDGFTAEDGLALYLRRGEDLPRDWQCLFDAVIRVAAQGDYLEQLRPLLSCPQALSAERAATDVPGRFIFSLARPVSALKIDEIPFEEPTASDPNLRQHLTDCKVCRHVFDQALTSEIRINRHLSEA